MTVAERSIGDITILDINGRITVQDGADEFRETVRRAVRRGRLNFVVNLRHVPYIDSTALGELVRAFKIATRLGGRLKLLSARARVNDLLTMTQLSRVFDSFETESEAVGSFGAGAR